MNKASFLLGLGVGILIVSAAILWRPRFNPGRCDTNCTGCVIAFDLSQRGIKCKARNFEPAAIGVSGLLKAIYPDSVEQEVPAGFRALKNALLEGGQRGYLRYIRKDGSRHVVAFFIKDGRVMIMDAQSYDFAIPLRVFLWTDRGETYRFARLDNIGFSDCELLDRLVERSGK